MTVVQTKLHGSLKHWIFRLSNFNEYNFDAMFLSTLLAGMSAYNNVERRMALLIKAFSDPTLPHDAFGTHLDCQRRTIDGELEK